MMTAMSRTLPRVRELKRHPIPQMVIFSPRRTLPRVRELKHPQGCPEGAEESRTLPRVRELKLHDQLISTLSPSSHPSQGA